MKNKKIGLLSVILTIAIVGIVVYFISRPKEQELLPQTFAQLPEKPKLIAEFHHGATLDFDAIPFEGFTLTDATPIYSVAFSPIDASLIASINGNGSIKLWNINNTKEPVKNLRHPGIYPTIRFSPTGELLASQGQGILVLWDTVSGKKINSLEPSSRNFAFSPDGHQLATLHNEVKLWDIRNPKKIMQIATLPFDEEHKIRDWACALSISVDGNLIAAGYSGGYVNVWNLQTKKHVKTLRTPFIEMRYLKFSPDNKYLVCGGPVPKRHIYLGKGNHDSLGVISRGAQDYIMWELPDWQRRGEIQRGHVEDIEFSPDGKICASMDDKPFAERGVELWSVENGAPITSLPTMSIARDIAFSHDGNLLAIGNFDGVVQVWKHNAQQLEAATPSSDVVRVIYTLMKDKEPSPNITEKLDKTIRDVQDFYADEMERHGFGRKTFKFETDKNGKAKIYLVKYNQPDIDLSNDIWLSFAEDSSMPFEPIPKLYYAHQIHSFEYTNKDGRSTEGNVVGHDIEGIAPGRLVSTSVRDLNRKSIAYLLRGTFGLPYIAGKKKSNVLKRLFTGINNRMPWGKDGQNCPNVKQNC
ncbi:MAG: hypothetical protein OXU23_23340 [Candidatus Poribacteria bacterium]|nr:hypothetical protein [Candidatus Poribacteria bacterium]